MRRSELLFTHDVPTPQFQRFLEDIGVPGRNLSEIDTALQQRFFQKKPGTSEPLERWELGVVKVSCPPARFRRHLELCGFADRTIPQYWTYMYAAWPGALAVRAGVRLADLIGAWESGVRWEETVVLGGKRPLQERETPREAIFGGGLGIPILRPESLDLDKPLTVLGLKTELDMMRWLWTTCALPDELRNTRAVFVDAPMRPPATPGGQPVRPNTEDTIWEWLNTSKPYSTNLLLSSGAPYGMAQDEAFWRLLVLRGIAVETFGHAASYELAPEVFMREVAGTVHQITLSRAA